MFCHFQSKVDLFLEGACTGDDHVVERLAGYKRCILARHPLTQASILHLAVIFNHTNVLQLLLARKTAPINAQDMVCSIYSKLFTMCQSIVSQEGRTPLHFAYAIAGTAEKFPIDKSTPPSDGHIQKSCLDILRDFGADDSILDYEGF